MKSSISKDDILREFSRANFKHVNDGALTENYCQAVVALVEENESLKHTIRVAIRYLESCGYDHAEEHEPERQMLESFRSALDGKE